MKTKVTYRSNHKLVVRKGADASEVVGKRFGAFVMTTARRTVKRKLKSGEPSEPGEPPRVGKAFKRNIVFDLDRSSRSVLIGPRLLRDKATDDAPEALEKGKRTTRRARDGKIVRRRSVRYPARPFMVPALEKRLPELPGLWKNVIRK